MACTVLGVPCRINLTQLCSAAVGRNLRRHAGRATTACRDLSAVKFKVDQRAGRLPSALWPMQLQQQQLLSPHLTLN